MTPQIRLHDCAGGCGKRIPVWVEACKHCLPGLRENAVEAARQVEGRRQELTDNREHSVKVPPVFPYNEFPSGF